MENAKNVAIKAAREAGNLLRSRLGNIKNIDYKSAFNIVTDVDKASEKIVIDILKGAFPDHAVLAEESGADGLKSDYCWLIDPLDGTTNYAHSYPFFCVSIGLQAKGEAVLGVVYNPSADELFWAEKGKGAWLNDKPIKVSSTDALAKSLLVTGFPPDSKNAPDNNMLRFVTLTDICHGVRRDGSAALDLSFVASGRLDGFWEMKLAPWDTGAGIVIVAEAGGRVTDLKGDKFDVHSGKILATNGLIHDEILSVLKSLGDRQLNISEAARLL